MDTEAFRVHGHRLIDWIAGFLEHIEDFPVLARVKPGEIASGLPVHPPSRPESLDAIFDDFEKLLLPGVTHWNHPGFFAYFPSSSSGPGILAELLSAALNSQAMLWRTGPAATELEEVALSWLRELMGLPRAFEGVIYDTASISSLHALAAARQAAVPRVTEDGLAARPELSKLAVYCSEEAHSSIEKAVMLLGFGRGSLKRISTDNQLSMKPAALDAKLESDRMDGITPVAVVATVGSTSTTSIDPVDAIADICGERGIWLHVDAAYGGIAAIVPEMRAIMNGVDRADSVVVNPHKWLFTPFDLSAMYCRRMEVVREAFSLAPIYLQTNEAPGVKNLMDTGIQLGRRFRALKLWAILRYFGAEGLQARVAEHIRLARLFATWIDDSDRFERLAPVTFSVVCFRATSPGLPDTELDVLNQQLMDEINRGGEIFISHTRIRGRFALRLAVGNIRTAERHVIRAWELLNDTLARLQTPDSRAEVRGRPEGRHYEP
jgi:aromatic-L-amino-acid decarboxylase